MIDGVIITPLRKIPDDRGTILHILKSSDFGYKKFGEVYCSTVFPGIVKGWHLHKKMTLNYIVIKGMIKFVLFDERTGSKTNGMLEEIYLGEANYIRVTVPPLIWNGFIGIGLEEAFVINVTDIPHDPNEIVRLDPHINHINYKWKVIDR
jgi:dTDP-4-dehydrorhamnose 3,5-epimerase